MKDHSEDLEPPKNYDYIPETYKNVWEDPNKFIPTRMHKTFNQKMFYNFVHRECFNSCISLTNQSFKPDLTETSCYDNCRSKHLSSMGIFSDIVLYRRKWDGFMSFINMREYQKDPDEMGKLIPTDPFLRGSILQFRDIKRKIVFSKSYEVRAFKNK